MDCRANRAYLSINNDKINQKTMKKIRILRLLLGLCLSLVLVACVSEEPKEEESLKFIHNIYSLQTDIDGKEIKNIKEFPMNRTWVYINVIIDSAEELTLKLGHYIPMPDFNCEPSEYNKDYVYKLKYTYDMATRQLKLGELITATENQQSILGSEKAKSFIKGIERLSFDEAFDTLSFNEVLQ